MVGNHPLRHWPLRRFTVVEDSMRPTLGPGDGLLAMRRRRPPARPVAGVPRPDGCRRAGSSNASATCTARVAAAIFEARSDNPGAPGVVDSHEFGWVPRGRLLPRGVDGPQRRERRRLKPQSRRCALVSVLRAGHCWLMLSGSTHSSVGHASVEHDVAEARWRRGPVGRSKSLPSIRADHSRDSWFPVDGRIPPKSGHRY